MSPGGLRRTYNMSPRIFVSRRLLSAHLLPTNSTFVSTPGCLPIDGFQAVSGQHSASCQAPRSQSQPWTFYVAPRSSVRRMLRSSAGHVP